MKLHVQKIDRRCQIAKWWKQCPGSRNQFGQRNELRRVDEAWSGGLESLNCKAKIGSNDSPPSRYLLTMSEPEGSFLEGNNGGHILEHALQLSGQPCAELCWRPVGSFSETIAPANKQSQSPVSGRHLALTMVRCKNAVSKRDEARRGVDQFVAQHKGAREQQPP